MSLAAFLEAMEGDDRARMRDLLLGPDGGPIADFLLDHYAMADAVGAADRPSRFGRFLLLGDCTPGGFAEVFQAWDVGLKCVVALKRPWAGANDAELSRFVEEAQVIAGLRHPHIVPIREFGQWQEVPYFTMPWCGCGSLRPSPRSPVGAARVMWRIASAVAHAHSCGVLHMDLKPSNILLDDDGQPLVADFGLALRPQPGGPPVDGRRGTPEYMSPEQAADGWVPATPRMDVYGLGAVLFYLLTGCPPVAPGDSRDQTLARLRANGHPSPRALNRAVPPDLDAVCRRCLEPDPGRRYPTAAAFADDLTRWLTFHPTEARPPHPARRAGLWCCRHPAVVAVVVTAMLVAGLAGQIAVQSEGRRRAEAVARERAELFRELAAEPMDPPRAGWRERGLGRVRGWIGRHPGRDDELRDRVVRLLVGADVTPVGRRDGIEASSVAFDPDRRRRHVLLGGVGERHPTRLWDHDTDELRGLMTLGAGPVGFREGRPLQLAAPDGSTPELWDLTGRRRLAALGFTAPEAGPLARLANGMPALAMSADCRRLAAARAGTVAVWEARGGPPLLQRAACPRTLALSADGQFLALGEAGGRVRVVPVGGGPEMVIPSPQGAEVNSVAFDPPGNRVAAGYVGGAAVFRLDGGQVAAHCHGGFHDFTAVAWSPNGAMLLTASGHQARVFDAHSGRPVLEFPSGDATAAAIADDGRVVAGVRQKFDTLAPTRVWQFEPGRGLIALPGLVGFTELAVVDDRGMTLAVLSHTWQVAVYDLETGGLRHTFRVPGQTPDDTTDNCDLAFGPGGGTLAVASGGRATLWSLADGAVTASWALPPGGVVNALKPAADGWLLFRAEGGGGRRVATIWGLRPGREPAVASRWPTAYPRITRSLAIPGGDRFVFFARCPGKERRLVALTSAGSLAWEVGLENENENVGLTGEPAGRSLAVRLPHRPEADFYLDTATGSRVAGAGTWPLCFSDPSVRLSPAGDAESRLYRQVVVGSAGGREWFRLGPALASARGFAVTRDGNRVVYPDGLGPPVVCVVPEVMRQLQDLGLIGR